MRFKMASAKWRPFCLGPNVLTPVLVWCNHLTLPLRPMKQSKNVMLQLHQVIIAEKNCCNFTRPVYCLHANQVLAPNASAKQTRFNEPQTLCPTLLHIHNAYYFNQFALSKFIALMTNFARLLTLLPPFNESPRERPSH